MMRKYLNRDSPKWHHVLARYFEVAKRRLMILYSYFSYALK